MADQIHVGMTPVPPTPQNYDVRLVTVERDVSGLKTDIFDLRGDMRSGFKDLTTAIAAKGQANWPALTLAVMALIAILGWGWTLLGNMQTRTEAAIAEQKDRASHFVDRQDIVAMFQSTKDVSDLKANIAELKAQIAAADAVKSTTSAIERAVEPLATKAALTATRDRVTVIESEIVSRHEHEIREAQVDTAMERLAAQERRDIDALERRMEKANR